MKTNEISYLKVFLTEHGVRHKFRVNIVDLGFKRWVSPEHYYLELKDPLNVFKFAFPWSQDSRVNWEELHYEWIVALLGKKSSPLYRKFADYYTAGEVMQLLKYMGMLACRSPTLMLFVI